MYKYGTMTFEWDLLKESRNLDKHKVSFSEAAESFLDPYGFSLRDTKHSINEVRFYWIGKTSSDRILTSWYTIREDRIRIIGSAEWREFKEYYNEKTKSR